MTTRARVAEILEYLGLKDSPILDDLRSEGLFQEDLLEGDVAEELRVATCLVRELGVNPAGVGVVLQLRRRLLALEGLMAHSLRRLLSEMDER